MTTIATDGKTMAGDGQSEHNGTILKTDATKVVRLSDGRILGCAGDTSFRIEFEKWLLHGGDRPKLQGDSGFSALIINQDGSVELSGHECVFHRVQLPFAVGSGMDLAIGAMEAGETPEEAVRIAIKRDPHTGGKITVLTA